MNASDQERERFYLLMLGVDTEENVEAGRRHLARQWRELRRNNPDLARTLKRMSVDQLAAFHDRLPRNDRQRRQFLLSRSNVRWPSAIRFNGELAGEWLGGRYR